MWSVWLVFCDCGFHSVCPLMDKDKSLVEALWWEGVAVGESGCFSDGCAMLSKSLIQFYIIGQSLDPSLGLRTNYDRGNGGIGDIFRKDLCQYCCLQCPWLRSRSLSTHASTGDSWTVTGKSGSVSCGVTVPFSWVLVHTMFFHALQESISSVLWNVCNQIPLASKVKFPGGSQSFCWTPSLGNLLWS